MTFLDMPIIVLFAYVVDARLAHGMRHITKHSHNRVTCCSAGVGVNSTSMGILPLQPSVTPSGVIRSLSSLVCLAVTHTSSHCVITTVRKAQSQHFLLSLNLGSDAPALSCGKCQTIVLYVSMPHLPQMSEASGSYCSHFPLSVVSIVS